MHQVLCRHFAILYISITVGSDRSPLRYETLITVPAAQDILLNLEWLKSPPPSSNETFEDKKAREALMRVSE